MDFDRAFTKILSQAVEILELGSAHPVQLEQSTSRYSGIKEKEIPTTTLNRTAQESEFLERDQMRTDPLRRLYPEIAGNLFQRREADPGPIRPKEQVDQNPNLRRWEMFEKQPMFNGKRNETARRRIEYDGSSVGEKLLENAIGLPSAVGHRVVELPPENQARFFSLNPEFPKASMLHPGTKVNTGKYTTRFLTHW
jgi:hypothetical protein